MPIARECDTCLRCSVCDALTMEKALHAHDCIDYDPARVSDVQL